jgi:hypothetical protein
MIPEPALNISAFYIPAGSGYYGSAWHDPNTGLQPFKEISNLVVTLSGTNTTFSADYIQKNGACLSSGVSSSTPLAARQPNLDKH